jgi:hypothetical protein
MKEQSSGGMANDDLKAGEGFVFFNRQSIIVASIAGSPNNNPCNFSAGEA